MRDGILPELKKRRKQISKIGQPLIPNVRTGKPQENYSVEPNVYARPDTKERGIFGSKKPILKRKSEEK